MAMAPAAPPCSAVGFSLSSSSWYGLRNQPSPRLLDLRQRRPPSPRFSVRAIFRSPSPCPRRSVAASAGRSKKKPGGPSPGRIEGNAEVRREAKRNARRKSRRMAENLFYRLKNPGGRAGNHADNFSDEELQMIGLGYDRMVRFMDGEDDPRLRHRNDWFKYGEYGPFSWRGVVVGEPIRGRLSDKTVTLIGEVRDHEEWERIERFEMAENFGRRLREMDAGVGFRYYWVFIRHPKWKITELPWQQWTLVSEVVVETAEKRPDKWALMGRLGNKTRELITKCAAWMRPDIIYVKRPVFQCRFEPQDRFFAPLGPLLDPATEEEYMFEVRLEDGRSEVCSYFGGLCKIVRVSPKAFVDDVVKAYERMSDERKSMCLEFLLSNHPMELLHPYTKEWKAKLDEEELGCDAPDDYEDEKFDRGETRIVDWIEDDGDGNDNGLIDDEEEEEEEEEDAMVDVEDGGDDEVLGVEEEGLGAEERKEYWDEQFNKALRSSEAMEKFVTKSVETSTKYYKKQLKDMDEARKASEMAAEGELMQGVEMKPSEEEWEEKVGNGPRRRIKKSKVPPGLFLRAAVRPFTYRNLVKEVVLMRHAIIDGEVSGKR